MPKVAKQDASTVEQAEGFEGRYQELDAYTVGFETYSAHADMAPVFVGLPDDRCQAAHWGVVLKGKVIFHYPDTHDVIETGEAYYARPGHTPEIFPDTEVVEFTRTDELKKTMQVVMHNLSQG